MTLSLYQLFTAASGCMSRQLYQCVFAFDQAFPFFGGESEIQSRVPARSFFEPPIKSFGNGLLGTKKTRKMQS